MTAGLISDIQKFCIHDGPGIRTTVFLKGCPLRCLWCHNPETQRGVPEIMFYPDKCIGCGSCLRACRNGAILDGAERVDRQRCRACGDCAAACPAEALVLCGKKMAVDEVVAEVMKDKPFYDTSGGGVTLSGGEPTMQGAFSLALLDRCGALGLHRVVETSGYVSPEQLREYLARIELLLIDLKVLEPSRHRELTGVTNELILSNIDLALLEWDGPVLLRIPLIPKINDSTAELADVAEYLQRRAKMARRGFRVELLKYNYLAPAKYPRLGVEYGLEVPKIADPLYMDERKRLFAARDIEVV